MPSSAANTPIIRPDRIRKAPKYWCGRSSMTSQPASTTMMVMKAVSGTNHIEMPSTPRWYMTLKRSIQGAFSTNCIAAVVVSKSVIRGMVTRKPATEPMSAIQRAALGFSWRPAASSRSPKATGTQMARERMLDMVCMGGSSCSGLHEHEPGHEGEHPQDHDQRVVIEVTGLEQADHRADHADQLGRAVDDQAVDQRNVTDLPEAAAQKAGTGGQDVLVEPVQEVLVLADDDERTQHLGKERRDLRGHQGEHVRGHHTTQGREERQRLKAVRAIAVAPWK